MSFVSSCFAVPFFDGLTPPLCLPSGASEFQSTKQIFIQNYWMDSPAYRMFENVQVTHLGKQRISFLKHSVHTTTPPCMTPFGKPRIPTPTKDLNKCINACHSLKLNRRKIFYIHIKDYNKCYIYVLLYFLITLKQYNNTRTGPQGARDNDYPVAINIKTCK